jgi:protein Mpv17
MQGGALVAPVLNIWYSNLFKLVPAQTTAGAIKRLLLDQLVFAPCFVSLFISTLFVLDGNADQVPTKLKQDLVETVKMNWKIWIPAQFITFRFVPPQLTLLATNFTALIWNAYLSWASNKAIAVPPLA